jgi:hypothetical protein
MDEKAKTADSLSERETDLRRFCVEMAVHWPTKPHEVLGVYQEVNLISRASRIYKWITK